MARHSRLLGDTPLTVDDATLTPAVQRGERLVIDTGVPVSAGRIVLAFTDDRLLLRRPSAEDGHQWLDANGQPPVALGPTVAIIGVAVERRQALCPRGTVEAADLLQTRRA